MSTYLLIPGAGGSVWYWHRVVPLLRAAGYDAIAVDLPGPDPHAGLPEYTDLMVSAIDGREDVVLVAASIGGFTAPLVAEKVPVRWYPTSKTGSACGHLLAALSLNTPDEAVPVLPYPARPEHQRREELLAAVLP